MMEGATYTVKQLVSQTTVLLFISFRDDIRGMRIKFQRIKPGAPLISRTGGQDFSRESWITGNYVIGSYAS